MEDYSKREIRAKSCSNIIKGKSSEIKLLMIFEF